MFEYVFKVNINVLPHLDVALCHGKSFSVT